MWSRVGNLLVVGVGWAYIAAVLALSLLQLQMRHSNLGQYCARLPDGPLAFEAYCLSLIILLQFGKTLAVCFRQVKFKYEQSQPNKMPDDPSSQCTSNNSHNIYAYQASEDKR